MFASTVTQNARSYVETSRKDNSTIRRIAGLPDNEAVSLTISHENAKNGVRSSVIIIDNSKAIGFKADGTPIIDTARVMFKLQYKPLTGRTDTTADLSAAMYDIVAVLTADSAAGFTKLINQES